MITSAPVICIKKEDSWLLSNYIDSKIILRIRLYVYLINLKSGCSDIIFRLKRQVKYNIINIEITIFLIL